MRIILLFIILLIIFLINTINCGSKPCFEYSCDECETEEYGKCTKCREGWTLIDGTCPCADPGCALCDSGLAGLYLCIVCKKGYVMQRNDCYCKINNCEQCGENSCLKCITGYFYNSTTNICEKLPEEEQIICYDSNCTSCFSPERGGCVSCKEGFVERKGECIELPIPDENNTCPENYYKSGNICLEKCGLVECNYPFYYFFEVYYLCPSNQCLVCIDNELKIFSECDNSQECSSIEGCLNCITNDECVICSQGYYLLNGICIKCIEGCSKCSNSDTCDYCMSGYQLDSELKCNLTYEFDYDVSVYKTFKQLLIEFNYKEEIQTITEPTTAVTVTPTIPPIETTPQTLIVLEKIPQVMECSPYCSKCNANTGKCLECEQLYILQSNRCIKQCSDKNCIDCLLENNVEFCYKCNEGYSPMNEKCNLICSDNNCEKCITIGRTQFCSQCKSGYKMQNGECTIKCNDEKCKTCSNYGNDCTECDDGKKLFDGKCADQSNICSQHFQFCNYCLGSERCVECQKGYILDDNKKKCQKNSSYTSTLFTIFGIVIILIAVISYCIYRKRKTDLLINNRRRRFTNGNNVHIYAERNNERLDYSGSIRSALSKDDLADEFELERRKIEKGRQVCQYCKKKIGKFTCDCGCIVCKEHSNLKQEQGDKGIIKVCFVCGKVVKKVTMIKYQCHICFQNKISVTHFKCGCALEVCKSCYIKCKLGSDKCPGCRAII